MRRCRIHCTRTSLALTAALVALAACAAPATHKPLQLQRGIHAVGDGGHHGVPVEYMLFENEGHYLVNLENRIAAQEAWLHFLKRHLRGKSPARRYRHDGEP